MDQKVMFGLIKSCCESEVRSSRIELRAIKYGIGQG